MYMSKKDTDLSDWSKLSGTVLSHTSHALAEAKQLRLLNIRSMTTAQLLFSNQVVSQKDVELPNWSKLSGAILSRVSDALTEVKQLNQAVSQKDLGLPNMSKLESVGRRSLPFDVSTVAKASEA
ncbi:hypothetical protein DFH29DRAFT_877383 [Suillus ampliporus]|nr:hypothetical protein DFH29DRAFT_877383 [Suillus ampliporus]